MLYNHCFYFYKSFPVYAQYAIFATVSLSGIQFDNNTVVQKIFKIRFATTVREKCLTTGLRQCGEG